METAYIVLGILILILLGLYAILVVTMDNRDDSNASYILSELTRMKRDMGTDINRLADSIDRLADQRRDED